MDHAEFPVAELRAFSRGSNVRGWCDLSTHWGLIVAAVVAVAWNTSWPVILVAFGVISLQQNALANLAHDGWHALCFRPKRLNDVLCAWFYSYPLGIPFFHDRQRHLQHHRLVGNETDPDWINYTNQGRETRWRLVAFLIGRVFGSLLVLTVWSILWKGRSRISVEISPEDRDRREFLKILVCQAVLFGAMTLAIGWWAYPVLWALPLVTVTACCNSIRAFVEHGKPEREVAPEQRLFDIEVGWVEAVLISPCHFNYHALHHAYPSIPHYRLPAAKRFLSKLDGGYPFASVRSYLKLLRAHIRRLS